MNTIDIVTAATDYAESLIASGIDYADAIWKASDKFHIGHRMIEAMYAERCRE